MKERKRARDTSDEIDIAERPIELCGKRGRADAFHFDFVLDKDVVRNMLDGGIHA